jgi:diguanylate cyclase (GGDEF)-like protein/PAS domain S-box-containing protein
MAQATNDRDASIWVARDPGGAAAAGPPRAAWRRGGLRLRLALVVVLAILPALGLALYTTLQTDAHERASARNQLREVAQIAAAREDGTISGAHGLLQVIAQTPEVRTGGEPCSALLSGVLANHAEYTNIAVFAPNGSAICAAQPFSLSLDVSGRTWFHQVVVSKTFTVGGFQNDSAGNMATLPVALPLLDGVGDVQAIIAAGIDARWLTQFASTIHASTPDAAMLVIDPAGAVVARSSADGTMPGDPAPAALAAAVAAHGDGAVEVKGRSGPTLLYGYAAIGPQAPGIAIAVSEPTTTAYTAASQDVHRDFILVGLTVLAALLVVAWLCEVMLLRSVRSLVATAWSVARGDLAARAPTRNGAGEINAVARAFNTMADALQERGRQAAEARAALHSSEARFRALVRYSSDLVCVLDEAGKLSFVSPAVETLLGYSAESLLGDDPANALHPDDREAAKLAFAQAIASEDGAMHLETRVRHADGSWVLLEVIGSNHVNDGDVRGLVLNCRDVTERHRLEEQLARRAHYDNLTSLPNRALFADRLGHALARASRSDAAISVLFLDLDGFKVVNDSLGHVAGDALLVTASHRLLACIREGDTVARLGGDEFAVLIEDSAGETAEIVAARMIEELAEPFDIDGRQIRIGGSAGIVTWSARGPALTADELLRRADIAMYRAKAAGKGRWVTFSEPMHDEAMLALDLQSDLTSAVENGEFELYYQPEIALDTQTVIGVEALVRWRHPRLGLLAPSQFIPLAEQSGVVHGLGRWVLREACQRLRQWNSERPQGSAPLTVAINLSARQFEHGGLADEIAAAIRESGIDPPTLRLEITETMALDNVDHTAATLLRLKALGVQLALDDFGTGYSSLSYLQRFTVDVIKIDRSFVTALDRNAGAQAIARAVVALAGALGATVTAEGVERPEQFAFLRAAGCAAGQGYYFAPPLPEEEIAALLTAGGSLGHGIGAGISA